MIAARQRAEAAREAGLRAALARPAVSVSQVVGRVVAAERDVVRAFRLRTLLDPVAENAPRLLCDDWLTALKLVAEASFVRPPTTWRPAGKSPERLFRSLAEHLFARHPMPAFLWTAFTAGGDAAVLSRLAVHLGGGGSLVAAVKSGLMPVPLTRAMCHDLMSGCREARFLDAVRSVQVRAVGGDGRLWRGWIATRAGGRLHDRAGEEFWHKVLAWVAASPVLPQAELSPLVDYVEHRRAEAAGFEIHGRSLAAMLRGMRQWHADLAQAKVVARTHFRPSGFKPMDLDRSRYERDGKRVTEVWHVREILDAKTLADEGRAMGHCVLSYASRIGARECSIWTLTLEDGAGHWRRLTLEVRLASRLIVQARGRFNRFPDPGEMRALQAWASRNALDVSMG